MEPAIFERFRDLIYQQCGIALRPDKTALLASRIQKRIRERGLKNESEYLDIIELDIDGPELIQLIDAISTNTTYFWREAEHFEILGNIFDTWKSQNKSSYKIWCAAASTGQEPYILAMEALEHIPPTKFDVRILATDVSTKALKASLDGIYTNNDVSKLPSEKRNKFLTKIQPALVSGDPQWKVVPELSELILFKRLNLVNFPYPIKGPMDIIFCRNVMIYFDVQTRQKIVNEFVRLLSPGGFLFLSLSESLLGIEHSLTKYSTSVYQK